MAEKGKGTDGLMRHIRDNHNIAINGSKSKYDLLKMGYYHGYKGYRFVKRRSNLLQINDFSEVTSIYEFDMAVKSLFYSPVMMIETAIKNYVTDTLVAGKECTFETIYEKELNYYKNYNPGDQKYKPAVKKRLELRKNIQNTILYGYINDNPVIQNFTHKDKGIPLWAVFEVISMGTLGTFLQTLNIQSRVKILESLKMYPPTDTNGETLIKHIFIIKDLRNALAHNHIIFDCRFKNTRIPNWILSDLSNEFSINNIKFNTLTDYLMLTIFYMKKLRVTKTSMKHTVKDFENCVNTLKDGVPQSTFNSIVGTDVYNKINAIKKYI